MLTDTSRTTDPQTSHDAAPAVHTRRTRMLEVMAPFAEAFPHPLSPATAIEQAAGGGGTCPWKRISDLKAEGYVKPVLGEGGKPLTEMGPNGKRVTLLKATGMGLSFNSMGA